MDFQMHVKMDKDVLVSYLIIFRNEIKYIQVIS